MLRGGSGSARSVRMRAQGQGGESIKKQTKSLKEYIEVGTSLRADCGAPLPGMTSTGKAHGSFKRSAVCAPLR